MTLDLMNRPVHPRTVPEASPQASMLKISVLGPLMIRRGDTELAGNDLGGSKPRQVLEILLLNFGVAVSKTRIIDLLWGDKQPAVALPTLESYVSVLRRHLQPGTGRSGPLRTVTGGYVLDRSLVDLDLDRFRTLTKQAAVAEPRVALSLLTEALDIASAPLLGDEPLPDWAEDERASYAECVSLARVLAAETALAVGEVGKAIDWARAAAGEDPLNERAWTALILGLERSGESVEALRCFDRYRRVLDEELGCAPNKLLNETHSRLLASTATTRRTATASPTTSRGTRILPMKERTHTPPASQPEAERLRVLIVDGHTTFSDLLAGALDWEPDLTSVGAAKTVESATTMFRDLRPDVVLVDLYLPDGSGLEAAGRILAEVPKARIVMLTGSPSQEALREAARLGICGFLPKDGSLGALLDTLRHAHPGNMIVHPSLITGSDNTAVTGVANTAATVSKRAGT